MVRRNSKKNGGRKKKSTVPARLSYGNPNLVTGSVGGISSTALHQQVVGLTNPWSVHARGSKVPDSDSSKSITSTISWPKTFSVNSSGKAAICVRPELNHNILVADAINGTLQQVITFNPSPVPVPDYAALEKAFDSYRIVSWGIRVYTTLAPTNQAGSYKIITLPEDPIDGFSWGGSLWEETASFPLSQQDIHWIAKPIGVAHKEYRALDTVQSWDRVFIAVEGAPASSEAFTIELVYNLECQINIGSISSTMATKAADHNPHVVGASSKTLAVHGGVHSSPSFGSIISQAAKYALVEGASAVMPMIGPLIRGMAGSGRKRNVPMIVD